MAIVRGTFRLLCLLAFASLVHAQPFIYYRGIVNAASFVSQGLPNGSVARGSIFAIFGRGIGPAQSATVSSFPLDTTFQGVAVRVCQNGNCIQAIPIFVSSGQVNAIMPSNAPLGPVSIRVVLNGQAGYYASATVVASSFGIFAINSGGFGPGVVQNFTAEAITLNSTQASARPGQTVILWGTGLGAGLNADNVAPQAGDLPVNVEIWVGGKLVTAKRYAGRSPCCAGVDQIVFDLPADTPTGCYVPVQIRTGGQVVSNSISIAVSADGSSCSDSFNPLSQMFREGGRLGLILANRLNALLTYPEANAEEAVEFAVATFREENGGPFAYNFLASLPPPGACTVHAIPGDFLGGSGIPAFRSTGGELNAGTSISFGGVGARKAAPTDVYYGSLAGTMAGYRRLQAPVTVMSGGVAVRGPGGADVGAVSVDLPAPAAINWPTREQVVTVDRSAGFRVDWQGGDTPTGTVVIAGVSANVPGNTSAVFMCTAAPGTSTFQVPAHITQALPRSPLNAYRSSSFGYAMAGHLPLRGAQSIPATGIRSGAAMSISWSARSVRYR